MTKHVQDQNWFAVFLDFFIVVAGILIAFQITNWNEARQQTVNEKSYLNRLHAEVIRAELVRQSLVEERLSNRRLLANAQLILFGRTDRTDLDPGECEAISEAYIYSNVTADLPTSAELISAGTLNIIKSDKIRTKIISLDQLLKRARDLTTGLNVNSVTLSQAYPHLIKLEATGNKPLFVEGNFRANCDTEKMRLDDEFLNDFVDSHFRYINYVDAAVQPVSDELERLHQDIDEELSIIHSKD